MNVPTGYTVLDFVGFTDKGGYDATETYVKNDIVYFGGSSWKCKVDNTIGIDPEENDNWTTFAEGGSGSVVNDKKPYVSRTGRDALAKMELVGGTVAWNQLVNMPTFTVTTNGVTSTASATTHTVRITSNGTNSNSDGVRLINQLNQFVNSTINGHKVLFDIGGNNPNASKIVQKLYASNQIGWGGDTTRLIDSSSFEPVIVSVDADKPYYNWYLYVRAETTCDFTLQPQIFDLTQMFGTTIADYVYSLEQSVEGSGIAWLKSYGFFTKDYYAYDAGSLQSVCTSGRKVTDLSGNEKTYPIDDVQLRGLFKLDTNNKLYCDGDVYQSSGAVTRKYGIVDLGSLTWAYDDSISRFVTEDLQNVIKRPADSSTTINLVNAIYKNTSLSYFYNNSGLLIAVGVGGNVSVKNVSYTDAPTFKTAMNGVYLVYELATETTETADPYINPQRSIENGTEEFVDGLTRDVMVPVGNNSQYTVSMLLPIICEYIDAVASASATTE